jgi:hypothetical protein
MAQAIARAIFGIRIVISLSIEKVNVEKVTCVFFRLCLELPRGREAFSELCHAPACGEDREHVINQNDESWQKAVTL